MKCKVGDYVICREIQYPLESIKEFLTNNIGYVTYTCHGYCIVRFENIPEEFSCSFRCNDMNNHRSMDHNEILHSSKNIEDLKLIIITNKYNL